MDHKSRMDRVLFLFGMSVVLGLSVLYLSYMGTSMVVCFCVTLAELRFDEHPNEERAAAAGVILGIIWPLALPAYMAVCVYRLKQE
jgi:hypothetical protein